MSNCSKVIEAMIGYFHGDVKRINHFMKVYGFAKTIGELEGIDTKTQEILEITAITHDIGIKKSEEKYNSSSGYYQQIEGPDEARRLLNQLEVDEDIVDRVCWIIAHHHTYTNIDSIDYQILVEADFLVNAYEDNMDKNALIRVKDKIFKTNSGIKMLDSIFKL